MCTSPALLLLVGALLGAAASPPAEAPEPEATAPAGAAADDPNDSPPPTTDEPAEDVRVVILSRGSAAFLRSSSRLLELPIAGEVEVMSPATYRKAATQAHIRKPNSIAAVQRLARSVHITHVVSITETRGGRKGDKRRFIEVVVARFKPSTTVLMAQRFFMPEHKLTATLTDVVKERILQALAIPAPPPAAPEPEPKPRERRRGHPARDHDHDEDADEGVSGGDEEGGDEDLEVSEDAGPAEERKPGQGRIWVAVGPTFGKRVASLTANTSNAANIQSGTPDSTSGANGTPPCYCGGGALSNTFPGVHLQAEGFWTPSGTALGLVSDLSVIFANTLVPLDVAKRTVSSVITDYEAGLALRWQTPIVVQVTPIVGYHGFNFPLTDGPFPGLSYSALWAAVRLGLDLADGMWNISLQADLLPFLGAHDEAVRLGKQTSGFGWGLSGGVRVALPWLEIALRLRFADYGLAFSGQTFLYTPVRYNNVSLDDRMGQLVLMVGSHFW